MYINKRATKLVYIDFTILQAFCGIRNNVLFEDSGIREYFERKIGIKEITLY